MDEWKRIAIYRINETITFFKDFSLLADPHVELEKCPVCVYMGELGYNAFHRETKCAQNENGEECPALKSCEKYLRYVYRGESRSLYRRLKLMWLKLILRL